MIIALLTPGPGSCNRWNVRSDASRQGKPFSIESTSQSKKENGLFDCKPVGSGLQAFKYLGLYISRVAISNKRILSLKKAWLPSSTRMRLLIRSRLLKCGGRDQGRRATRLPLAIL
ncbi:MAG: hypothetical protein DMF61_24955 [Blastocatellia bacterium AA13]|nr:MAG: hypothetical protein DMF61_24955 [Blastocatellia bacterium AA13]